MIAKILDTAKAVAGSVIAFCTALSAALPDGITTAEWLTVIAATVAAYGIVWAVPNRGVPGEGGPSDYEPIASEVFEPPVEFDLPDEGSTAVEAG
jgi:hypothetical protein